MRFLSPFSASVLLLALVLAGAARAADLRIGLIGLDTSHVIAFTKTLNDPTQKDHIPGAKVVAIFKGGSPDIHSSASRVEGYTADLLKYPGIKLYATIAELVQNVDAVMIESVDGRPHLAQFKEVMKSGKPVFIDKPVAASLRDTIEIFRLAKQHQVPVFSTSSLRYTAIDALAGAAYGDLHGAFTYGPASLEPTHPDLFWYGIHAIEMLYTILGRGCETVARTHVANTDIVTGVWSGGRVGTMRGTRNSKGSFGLTVFGSTAVVSREVKVNYNSMLKEIVTFFKTRVAPVSPEDTIELVAFMEAADESKRRGGAPVRIADVIAAATAK